jgi:hypothetical protein
MNGGMNEINTNASTTYVIGWKTSVSDDKVPKKGESFMG